MSADHHGQHARCRACGTNPRGRPHPVPEPAAPPTPELCADCGATRTWVWSTKHERLLLRRCPCHAPAGDPDAAKARIAAIRAQLDTTKEQRA